MSLSGLGNAVIGGFLLWAARRPRNYVVLVPLIIALELLARIIDDLYLVIDPHDTAEADDYGFIVLHLVITRPVTGSMQDRTELTEGLDQGRP